MKSVVFLALPAVMGFCVSGCRSGNLDAVHGSEINDPKMEGSSPKQVNATGSEDRKLSSYHLDFDTPVDPALQGQLEKCDLTLRERYGMTTGQVAVGLLDLKRLRLAMVQPDRIEYAASVAKIGILLAYFELHPAVAANLDAQTRHELGL